MLNILGSPYLSYEELGNVHWRADVRLVKATSPRKEEERHHLSLM